MSFGRTQAFKSTTVIVTFFIEKQKQSCVHWFVLWHQPLWPSLEATERKEEVKARPLLILLKKSRLLP